MSRHSSSTTKQTWITFFSKGERVTNELVAVRLVGEDGFLEHVDTQRHLGTVVEDLEESRRSVHYICNKHPPLP